MKFSAVKKRQVKEIAAQSLLAFLDSVSPVNGLTSNSQRYVKWSDINMYFDGMADPYKVFSFRLPGENGSAVTYSMSTAELMKIDRAGYQSAQSELSAIISELQDAGIISNENPWRNATFTGYLNLDRPNMLLSDMPANNDVFIPNPQQKLEGMAVPSRMEPAYVTPRVFDRNALPDNAILAYIERIYAAVGNLHNAANCNPALSPAVHSAMNRLGFTRDLFASMDATASDPLVPKTPGIPENIVRRGAWSDNRYFGDVRSDRSVVYSNKNAYLPDLGAANDSRVPNIYRNGPIGNSTTRFINPCFPEYLSPIHCVKLPSVGAPATAGFTVVGRSDPRYRLALSQRRPIFTFSDQCILSINEHFARPSASYPGSNGNVFSEVNYVGTLASFTNSHSRTDETNGPYG